MIIGNKTFDLENKSYIMGILNVTPDSFSDGGRFSGRDDALRQAETMIEDGAAIIDVGGESTRPGYTEISEEEEIGRVAPVIELIKANFDIPVSLDTYKCNVAAAGIAAGADMINDIWGLRKDQGEMADLIARTGVACCLMHNRERADYSDYPDFMTGFRADIDKILEIARNHQIKDEQIILDPGIGFGKSYKQNLLTMKNLSLMQQWKLPFLLGTSRKSMIGYALDLPVNEREEGTLATTVMGRMAGASIFRVHHVKMNLRALKMADAILGAGDEK
ncbi:MAG: dihydropteroate synthase [Eubacterium sp.]|nr:dihydropteroate synthase [Eubacterium sp.]